MFHCSECGHGSVKWLGKCPTCGVWESFVEEKNIVTSKKVRLVGSKNPPVLLKDVVSDPVMRIPIGLADLDRLLGQGLVPGEVILIGGEPGVGKSTLLLEASSHLSKKDKTLYVSAEESPQQILLRAKRLEKDFSKLFIVGEDNLDEIFEYVKQGNFKFIVVDSIQVMYCPRYEGFKGSVSQIRGCAEYLTYMAKTLGVIVFIVGHVTKEGIIAGPKLLEHIVDCVLYFEGEIISNYRILRAIKNRFGATGDIAVFEMGSYGLREVKKTDELFLPHRDSAIPGSCVTCVIEGVRPMLIELQSLVSRANFGVARRRSLGFDFNRFSLLIAIIEKRLKISLSSEDVFLNIAGGLKVTDPSADLAASMAIISSSKDKVIEGNLIFIAEVGLAGELRRVNNINMRLKEAKRAGFDVCFIPESNLKEVDKSIDVKVKGVGSLGEVVNTCFC